MSDQPAVGQAVALGRGGFAFMGVVTGDVNTAVPIHFLFAGGLVRGTPGTYQVYNSVDNNVDPYEPVDGLEITVVTGRKTIIPSDMFNVGWIKFVGPQGVLNVYGAG